MPVNEEEQGISTEEFNTFRESFEHDRLTAGVDIRQLPYGEEKLQQETLSQIDNIVAELENSSPAAKAAEIAGDSCNIFDSMSDLVSGPQAAIGAAADGIGDAVGGVTEGIGDAVGGITDGIGDALSPAQEAAKAAGDAVGEAAAGAKAAIGGILGGVNELSLPFDNALGEIKEIAGSLQGASQEVLDGALGAFRDFQNSVNEITGSVFGGISDALSSATDVIGEGLQTTGAAGSPAAKGAADKNILDKAGALGINLEGVESPADLSDDALALLEQSGELPKSILNVGKLDKLGGAALESTKFPGKTLADLGQQSANDALAGVASFNENIGPAAAQMESLTGNLDSLKPPV